MSLFDKRVNKFSTGSYSVFGKKIICPVCDNDLFENRDVLLNTPGMTFLGLDWANKTAIALICTKCGKIEWYLQSPVPVN